MLDIYLGSHIQQLRLAPRFESWASASARFRATLPRDAPTPRWSSVLAAAHSADDAAANGSGDALSALRSASPAPKPLPKPPTPLSECGDRSGHRQACLTQVRQQPIFSGHSSGAKPKKPVAP